MMRDQPAAPAVYIPQPITYPAPAAAPLAPVQTVQLPDGRIVSGYAVQPAHAVTITPATPAVRVSPLAVNALLASGSFALACLGLDLLASFIEALAHLVEMLVILAAILCAAPVLLQLARAMGGTTSPTHQTVIHARRVRIKNLINK